ncbi:MAG: hypothetical protein FJY55_09875 [Betaproteobacteria bacterium]|nr:hypothetical protein [Betaproteobacteria bacterium]
MKPVSRLSTYLLVALLALLASTAPASAEQRGPMRRAERPPDNALGPRPADQRGLGPPPRQANWPGQMSPEERRQLRRDIDEHGRDLYRERRERR